MPETFDKFYAQLNTEQKLAVDTIEGPVMVLAGPGTGKTQTIAVRIARILSETQVDPSNILCLTFTETASLAMRKRLLDIIGTAAYYVRIFTFHGFCNEVIQDNLDRFPELTHNSQAIIDTEKISLMQTIIDALPSSSPFRPFRDKYHFVTHLLGSISQLKKENITPADLAQNVKAQAEFAEIARPKLLALKAIKYNQLTEATFQSLLTDLKAECLENPLTAVLEHMIHSHTAAEYDDAKSEAKGRTALRKQIIDEFFLRNLSESALERHKQLVDIYQQYQEELRQQERYDFDDMITSVLQKFQSDQELLQIYQERYQYILVDEYQDTNTAQNKTVELLGSFFPNPNIFVVGDDDQSIYRFQGASIENVVYFYEKYKKHLTLVSLKNNYRSSQLILDAADYLISHNAMRLSNFAGIEKKLTAQKDYGLEKIEILEAQSQLDEDFLLAEKIQKLLKNGVAAEEIAVLYRKNADATDLADYLQKSGIPVRIERGEDILQDEVISELIALLRYLGGKLDDARGYQVLHFPFAGLPRLDLMKLSTYLYKTKQAPFDVISDPVKLQAAGIQKFDVFVELSTKLAGWSSAAERLPLVQFFTELLHDSGILRLVLARVDNYLVLQKLNRLYDEIKSLASGVAEYRLRDFVAHLQVLQEYDIKLQTKFNTGSSAVRLMTAHSAKGLEFEHVFIYRTLNGKWGNNRDQKQIRLPLGLIKTNVDFDPNDEERRLFFVALTRAKKQVHISYSKYNTEQKEQIPSLFLSEIESALLQRSDEASPIALSALETSLSKTKKEVSDTDIREYLSKLLENYRLSVTHLNAYSKCPRAFLLNTILRVPKLKSKSQALGTAVHAALKDVILRLQSSGKLPTVEQVLARFEQALTREQLSPVDFAETLEIGNKILGEFYAQKSSEFVASSIVEMNLSSHNIHIDDVPVTGMIDRIDRVEGSKDEVIVVDYKTGKPDNKYKQLSSKNMGEYYKQLLFYKLLLENSHQLAGAGRVHYKVTQGKIVFIEPDNKGAIKTAVFDLLDADVEKLKVEMKDVYARIMNQEFSDCEDSDMLDETMEGIGI